MSPPDIPPGPAPDASEKPPPSEGSEGERDIPSFLRALARAPAVEPAALVPWPEAGEVLGHHRIDRLLGQGAMGRVYLAWDLALGRAVALKLLKAGPTGARAGEALLSEGRRIAALDHPNIVAVYGTGHIGPRPYLELAALKGQVLADALRAERPTPEVAAGWIYQAALGLAHAHGNRPAIVHRDIKPSNLFLTDEGVVKILDFGVASLASEAAHRALPPEGGRALVGTLPYMAPEICAGRGAEARSDLYSLGITFFEALTGQVPFLGTPDAILSAHISQAPPPLTVPAPPALVAILMRLLQKDPAARYPDARALAGALREALAGALPALPALSSAPGARPRAEDNPYPGLEAFGPGQRQAFHGRERLIARALAQLAAMDSEGWAGGRILPLLGPSGCGKSSLAFAGLLPRLSLEGGAPRPAKSLTPGARPLESLGRALGVDLPGAGGAGAPTEGTVADAILGALGGGVLLVDQLEEAFTLCDDAAAVRAFLMGLLRAGRDPRGPLILLTLRSDYLAHTQPFPGLGEVISEAGIFVPPLDPEALEAAIARPAADLGWPLDPSTVSRLVEQASGREGALPLLQFTLRQIWAGRAAGRAAGAILAEVGGVGGALATCAQALYEGLGDEERGRMRRILLSLAWVGEGGEITRRRVALSELVWEGERVEAVRALLGRLSAPNLRLVLVGMGPGGEEVAEVSHEALFTHWRTFAGWLEEERGQLRLALQLGLAAGEWEGAGRPEGLLWRPPKLTEVEAALAGEGLVLNARQRRFVDASTALQARTLGEQAQRAAQAEALQEMTRRADPSHRIRNRLAWTALVASFGVLFPCAGALLGEAGVLRVGHGLHLLGLAFFGLAALAAMWSRQPSRGSDLNHRLGAGFLGTLAVMGLWQGASYALGAPMERVFQGDVLATLHMFALMGVMMDRRFLWALPAYCAALVLAWILPGLGLLWIGLANLVGVSMVAVAWFRDPSSRPRGGAA